MTPAQSPETRALAAVRSAFRAYRPLRFLIVGGFNTALCYLVYAGLVWAGMAVWTANFGALLFGIGVSFLTQGRIVFGNKDPRRFVRFLASWLVIYAVQTAALEMLVRHGVGPFAAGLIVLPATAVASYFVQKRIVFHHSESAT
jgi:putative flippase GtrA